MLVAQCTVLYFSKIQCSGFTQVSLKKSCTYVRKWHARNYATANNSVKCMVNVRIGTHTTRNEVCCRYLRYVTYNKVRRRCKRAPRFGYVSRGSSWSSCSLHSSYLPSSPRSGGSAKDIETLHQHHVILTGTNFQQNALPYSCH